MSPFAVLGIPSNSSIEVAERAWRSLRTQHHPDKGGDEKKFKEAKAAWEQIKGGYRDGVHSSQSHNPFRAPQWEKPEPPKDTWRNFDINDLLDELKRTSTQSSHGTSTWWRKVDDRPKGDIEFVANVSIREAFLGFNVVVPSRKWSSATSSKATSSAGTVSIPPGTPHGYSANYVVSDGTVAFVTTRIDASPFRLRGFASAETLFGAGLNIGDVELDCYIDETELRAGTWIEVKDFLSTNLKVRVPAGFNPVQRLKVAGKGYAGWDHIKGAISSKRADMYLKLIPVTN